MAYFGLRMAGKPEDARADLSKWSKRTPSDAWVQNIAQYLQGSITEADLLAKSDINEKLTSSHAYIGLNAFVSGDKKKAVKHLRWVIENGAKSSQEFLMAKIIVGRMDGSKER